MTRRLAVLTFVLSACGGGHDAATPSSTPIAPVTADAVYVVNGDASSISVLDAARDTVLGTIELADAPYPHHLYLSGDRRDMYLAVPGVDLSGGHAGHDGGDHAFVMRLDAATGETLAVASLPSSNHNALPSPDGTAVWTTQMTDPGKVLLLDATTLARREEVEVGALPAEVTFGPDGSHAFVANSGSASVSAIDADTLEVAATLEVGETPVGAWPGADGMLYVDSETSRSISAIDPDTLEVARTYQLDFAPAFAAAFGGELWVTDPAGGRVVFFDLASGDEVGALDTGAGAHAIAVSPDEARAWVSNQAAGSVSIIDVAAREVAATVAVGAAPNGLAYRAAP